ncbi:hypothetical protein BC833DRAFT_624674 [Globomyces pollinis-pini]|nr:hypothetical protein BC833DRAFT_624674 [Globomyces pollinis-pini]
MKFSAILGSLIAVQAAVVPSNLFGAIAKDMTTFNRLTELLPVGEKLIYSGNAEGTQNYVCVEGKYVLDFAEALLISMNAVPYKRDSVHHYFLDKAVAIDGARPTWKYDADGSIISGKALIKKDDPNPKNIQWLKVGITQHTGNTGFFSNVKTVLRVNTDGGVPPATCTGNSTAQVNYKTDYLFFQ